MSHPFNPERFIASDGNPELDAFIAEAHRLSVIYGHEEIEACIAQAIVGMKLERFLKKFDITKQKHMQCKIQFKGDHRSYYQSNKGFIYRSDEYPLSFDSIVERISDFQKQGLDGHISGQSIHRPGVTFAIVTHEKGAYSTNPGI